MSCIGEVVTNTPRRSSGEIGTAPVPAGGRRYNRRTRASGCVWVTGREEVV